MIPGLESEQPEGETPKYATTHLDLTPDQVDTLTQRVRARIDECRKEMGLDVSIQRGQVLNRGSWGTSYYSSGFGSKAGSWAWRREIYDASYHDDFEWRKAFYPLDSIFQSSNYSKNIPQPLVRKLDAKLNETQFGTDPYFATIPQQTTAVVSAASPNALNMAEALQPVPMAQGGMPLSPPALASPAPDDPNAKEKAWEAYVQRHIDNSNFREAAQETRLAALVRNDATTKLTWTKRTSTFVGPAKVLVAPDVVPIVVGVFPDGTPVMGVGPYITDDGRMIPGGQPVTLADGRCIYASDDVIPAPLVPGGECLLKDPTFILPPWATPDAYVDLPAVEQVEIEYEGLDASMLDFKDFLFPIKCRSFKEADFFCHIWDATLNELRALYGDQDTFELYAQAYGVSSQQTARPDSGEQDYGSVRELIGVHDCYLLFDANGDGKDEWIYAVYDYKGQKLIFFDYLKNIMARVPFVMVPGVEKEPLRACGRGVYELLAKHSEFVDMQLNRWNYMASKQGSATFLREGAIIECKDGGQEFILGTDQVWTIANDSPYGPDKPPVFRVNLAEQPDNAVELMNDREKTAQAAFGDLGQADGQVAGLPGPDTATGASILQQTSNALQDKTADLHATAFTDMLRLAVQIIQDNMPEQTAFYGDDGVTLYYLSKQEAKSMQLDVRLLLTKARSADTLAKNAQAIALVTAYSQQPKAIQKTLHPFYVDSLKALGVNDADDKLKMPTDQEIAAEAQANAQPEKPPGATVAAKLGDFVGSERPQIVQKYYEIQPASPQEVQQAALANVQQQSIPIPEHHPHILASPNASAAA